MSLKDRTAYNVYMRTYMLKRYRERRKHALKTLGGCCAKCGAKKGLELDHKDPATKAFGISQMWSVSKKRYEAELRKCQLLCSRCHREKTNPELSVMATERERKKRLAVMADLVDAPA